MRRRYLVDGGLVESHVHDDGAVASGVGLAVPAAAKVVPAAGRS